MSGYPNLDWVGYTSYYLDSRGGNRRTDGTVHRYCSTNHYLGEPRSPPSPHARSPGAGGTHGRADTRSFSRGFTRPTSEGSVPDPHTSSRMGYRSEVIYPFFHTRSKLTSGQWDAPQYDRDSRSQSRSEYNSNPPPTSSSAFSGRDSQESLVGSAHQGRTSNPGMVSDRATYGGSVASGRGPSGRYYGWPGPYPGSNRGSSPRRSPSPGPSAEAHGRSRNGVLPEPRRR